MSHLMSRAGTTGTRRRRSVTTHHHHPIHAHQPTHVSTNPGASKARLSPCPNTLSAPMIKDDFSRLDSAVGSEGIGIGLCRSPKASLPFSKEQGEQTRPRMPPVEDLQLVLEV